MGINTSSEKKKNDNSESKFDYLENLITTELIRSLQETRPDSIDQLIINNIEENYTFPENFHTATSLLDYLRLKVKERILEILILETTLIVDAEKKLFVNISDAERYEYYYDLRDHNLEALHTSFDAHNSFEPIIYRSLRNVDYQGATVKSKARTKHKGTIQYRHEEFSKAIKQYSLPELPLQKVQVDQSTCYTDADKFNLHTLISNYLKPFDVDFFKSNLAFLHYAQEFRRPEKSRKELNEIVHFSPFTGFVILNFGSNTTIFNKCVTLNDIIDDEKASAEYMECVADINNLYQDHVETAVKLLDSLVALHGQDSHTALCTDIHFSNLLHYQFFESIRSPLFKYCTQHINFAELVKYGSYVKKVQKNDTNSIETITDTYSIGEGFFYLSFLLLCMTFHINLDDLEKYQLCRCTPQKAITIVDESKMHIRYTPAVALNINAANNKMHSLSSTLRFIINFLQRSDNAIGSILQTYLEENGVIASQDESNAFSVDIDKLDDFLHDCAEELNKLRNRNTYLHRGQVRENDYPNDMPKHIIEEFHESTRYIIDANEQKCKVNFESHEKNTTHILSFLLKHPATSGMLNL